MNKLTGGSLHRSHYIAIGIAVAILLWFMSGLIGGDSNTDEMTAAEKDAASDKAVHVQVAEFVAQDRQGAVVIRGRSEAKRAVQVRAETQGTIAKLPVEKGERVVKGQTICELNLDARGAQLAEVQAVLRQRKLEYDASRQLAEKGYRAPTTAAGSKAAYDAAAARLKQMQVEVEQTKIVAPFDGVLDDRPTEVGDYIRPGEVCGLVVELNPLLIVGQVSESQINGLSVGATGTGRLVTGDEVTGKITFVAKTADPATRTFQVELSVPNDDFAMRSGVTAEIIVPSNSIKAHRIPSSIITLDDKGVIGVRAVGADGVVEFNRVELVDDTPEGLWVSGLPAKVTLIVVGQDYVKEGEKVVAVPQGKVGDAS